MGSTKIINVLKDDRFEDVLDAFKKTPAEEVIFIFPKNSKLSKKEEHFASLASEAAEKQKQITIMTADQNVEKYAKKYGFRFLMQAVKNKKILANKTIANQTDNDKLSEDTPDEEYNGNLSQQEEKIEQPEEVVEEAEEAQDLTEETEENENDEELAEDQPFEKDEDHQGIAELTMARLKTSGNKGRSKTTDKKFEKLESIWLKRESLDKPSKKTTKNSWGRSGPKKLNIIFSLSALVILFVVLFAFLGNAQVIIKPQKQKLSFDLPIVVSTDISQSEAINNKIPGQFLAFRADVSKDFAVTGKAEVVKKSRGEITVFNNFNSDPQNLVATTRFESSKGLIFRIPRSITIPGAKMINGKLSPGSINVEVIADKPGQEYNINTDRFTIPGFSGTPKFTGFYAESNKPMSGGITGQSAIVTEKDFNLAKETITKEALAKSLENLKTKTGNLETVEPVNNEIISLKSTAQTDDATEGFAMAAIAEAKTISFSKDDLLKIIETFINKNGDLMLLKEGVGLDYKNVKFDFEKKSLSFIVAVTGEAATKINENKLIDGLVGMKQNQIEDYLLSFKEIDSARVILSPFWVRSIPKNKQYIHVKIVY